MNRIRLLGTVGISLVTLALTTAGSAVAEPPPGAVPATTATAAQQAGPTATGGRTAAFLRVDGPQGTVQGESTDSNHKGWIELYSFSFGATQANNGGASGTSAGRVAPREIVITKHVDKSSPALHLASASGTHFKNAVIEMTKPSSDGRAAVYYRVTMTDVIISSDRETAPTTPSGVPNESVTLNFTKVNVEYSQQKPDGTSSPYQTVQEGWDVKTNVRM
ncbi:MAG TPA: type VI secretion system tube protein Hcp [Polyangiaceae bacterium]